MSVRLECIQFVSKTFIVADRHHSDVVLLSDRIIGPLFIQKNKYINCQLTILAESQGQAAIPKKL